MNNATFLSVQLNADDFSGSSGRIAQPAPAVRDRRRRGGRCARPAGERRAYDRRPAPGVELPVLAIERLRDALDTLSGYDETWLQVLEPAEALVRDIGHRRHALH